VALRTLDQRRSYRTVKQIPPCPPDWHPHPGTKWEELDRVHLAEHPEARERWFRNLYREGSIDAEGRLIERSGPDAC
jgi:hypothetical protein